MSNSKSSMGDAGEDALHEPESKPSPPQNGNCAVDTSRFDKSLQELRGLRSQLHYAADYCEKTSLNAQDKKMMIDNTKEYICKAVVTFVDHLGNVSSNLDHHLSLPNAFSEAELRINSIKQRLELCEQYAQKVALTRLRWNPTLPAHHPRYLSTPTTDVEKKSSKEADRNGEQLMDKHVLDLDDLPLFLYTASDAKSASPALEQNQSASPLVHVRDALSVSSKATNPTFHFQQFGSPRDRRKNLYRRRIQSANNIVALMRKPRDHHERDLGHSCFNKP